MSQNNSRVLFVIPARGGSKGLPGKNIRPLLGKPLVAWTIATALEAAKQCEGRVVVSTDDKKIAAVAKKCGAEVPFLRPAKISGDTSTSVDVILHALEHFEKAGEYFGYVCMLEPTSPQRDAADVIGALHLLQKTKGAKSIVGVCKTESTHPAFLAGMKKNNFITPFSGKKFIFKRRQEIDDVYFFEGSLYISAVKAFKKRKSFYHDKTLGYAMPKWKSFEVDDLTDFILIERLMLARRKKEIK